MLEELHIDDYRVVRLLGAGGMGAVYEVVGDDGRRFAIKLFNGAKKNGGSSRLFMRSGIYTVYETS